MYIIQGAKKVNFTACHSSKLSLQLAYISPKVISAGSSYLLMSKIDNSVLLYFESLKKLHLLIRQGKKKFASPIAKSTSPRLSDTSFFARCHTNFCFQFCWEPVWLWSISGAKYFLWHTPNCKSEECLNGFLFSLEMKLKNPLQNPKAGRLLQVINPLQRDMKRKW